MVISDLLFLILGLILVVVGSDFLVDGASDIARRSGLSEFVIGLTIVGIGTSTPEMVVSWMSAFQGNTDMAVGNIIGSNIFNVYLILGVTAIILPIEITKENLHRDIPANIFVTLALILLGFSSTILKVGQDTLSRADGIVFLLMFAVYLYFSFKYGKAGSDDSAGSSDTKQYKHLATAVLLVAGGLAGLIFGGRLFVNKAIVIARDLGWSEKFIGITILAGGTSLPELATCVVAAFKKKGQLALGNIIGSNISNILLILGGSAVISPLPFNHITGVDAGFLLLSSLFLLAAYFTFDKKRLDRSEGVAMLMLDGAYMYLLITAL